MLYFSTAYNSHLVAHAMNESTILQTVALYTIQNDGTDQKLSSTINFHVRDTKTCRFEMITDDFACPGSRFKAVVS